MSERSKSKRVGSFWAYWGGDKLEHLWTHTGKLDVWKTPCGKKMLIQPLEIKHERRCTKCLEKLGA